MIAGAWVRNGVFIAILAQGLIGVSLLWDKVLLRRPATTNLVNYVFWLGAISIFGVAVIPFGFHLPAPWVMALAFATGVVDLGATYLYYAALKGGEASGTVAAMGGFSPVATVLVAQAMLPRPLGESQKVGFAVLVAAGFLMFAAEHLHLNLWRLAPRVLAASAGFGAENVLQKVVFDASGFVPGFVFISLGTFCASLALLTRRSWREQIFSSTEEAPPSSRGWYFVNRFIAGLGSFLVFYAISLTHPAVVDALSGVRYGIVFVGAYALTKWKPAVLSEYFRGWVLAGKSAATAMVAAGLVLLARGPGK